MHVSFRATKIDWLIVVAYELTQSPVVHCCYCFSVQRLLELAARFESRYGSPVIPLRHKADQLRLEWSALKTARSGRVRGSTDTWEQRTERAREILGDGYAYEHGKFKKGIAFKTQPED